MLNNNFKIESVNTKEKYEGLRTLWCEVFDDDPDFVDAMYKAFGANRAAGEYSSDAVLGYVIAVKPGGADPGEVEIASALTCFLCGTYEGLPVYTSYAICTDPKYRGLGLAGRLVEQARDDVTAKGGISLISPAEPSLENFYGAHGYTPFFFVDKKNTGGEKAVNNTAGDEIGEAGEGFIFDEEDGEYEKVRPGTRLKALDAAEYNDCRERFLEDIPHVALNEQMLGLVHTESTMPDGSSGFVMINDGDAICTLSVVEVEHGTGTHENIAENMSGPSDEGRRFSRDGNKEKKHVFAIEELIINPALAAMSSEIAEEIAAGIAEHFGLKTINYKTPGGAHCQSMAAGLPEAEIADNNEREFPAYYGFPIE